jgi:hypothetical protein
MSTAAANEPDIASFDKLSDVQTFQLLTQLLRPDTTIEPVHLDLAIRHKQFRSAILILYRNVTSPNLCSLISTLLSSPRIPDTDFHLFLLTCVLFNFDLSPILDSLDTFTESNVQTALIPIIPLLIAGTEQPPASPLFQPVLAAANERNYASLVYTAVKQSFTAEMEALRRTKLSDFPTATTYLASREVKDRLSKLATATSKTFTGLSAATDTGIEKFKTVFSENLRSISEFLTTIDRHTKLLGSAVANIKLLIERISRAGKSATFVSQNFLKPFLDSPDTDFNQKLKNLLFAYAEGKLKGSEFDSSLVAIQTLSAFIAFLRLNNFPDTFLSSLSQIPDRLSTDILIYQETLVNPVETWTQISRPGSDLWKSVRAIMDQLMTALHLAECGLLEAIVREEELAHAGQSSCYPIASRDILKTYATPAVIANAVKLRQSRDDLLAFVSNELSGFISSYRSIPGVRGDLKYVDFMPTKKWAWPQKWPGAQFPATPEDARQVLAMRVSIRELVKSYMMASTVAICRTCNKALAAVVCPKCRRLVLCNLCAKKSGKCPVEGCDVTFELTLN